MPTEIKKRANALTIKVTANNARPTSARAAKCTSLVASVYSLAMMLAIVWAGANSDAEISYYLDHENALDCAGSAKSEGLGAALIKQMTSDDPTALIGLPLLALIDMLNAEGVKILQ